MLYKPMIGITSLKQLEPGMLFPRLPVKPGTCLKTRMKFFGKKIAEVAEWKSGMHGCKGDTDMV